MATHELRFALTFEAFDDAVRLFRDALGLEVAEDVSHDEGRGLIFTLPSATLEVFDRDQERYIDGLEAGDDFGTGVRIAVRIDDLEETGAALESAGASPVAEAVETPWGDRNRRFATSDGLQMTLFQPPGA